MTGGARSNQASRYFSDVSFPARVEDVQESMVASGAPRAAIRALDEYPRGHVFRRAADVPLLPGMQLHPPDNRDHDATVVNELPDLDTRTPDVK